MNRFLVNLLSKENERQENCINLIASENYVSKNVIKAITNVFTNKYAEGYPGKRYYQGCTNVDQVEKYAISRLLQIYGAEAANVQPHSGSQANQAVYQALLSPNDCVLAMSTSSGGHLTHGLSSNFSGTFYKFVHYNVNKKTCRINYSEIHKLAELHRPKMIIAGASSYSQIIDFKKFREICNKVNAYLMVDMAHIAGLVAANLHPSPVPYADVITSSTHKTLRGPRGGFILCQKRLLNVINKAVFPGVQGGPFENIIFAKAVAFDECLTEDFKKYSVQTLKNAKVMCEKFIKKGIKVISNGTKNHQFSIDVKKTFNMTGKAAADKLAKYQIYVNQNMIPFDTEKPLLASGIRIGTPAITSKGANGQEAEEIADLVFQILNDTKSNINVNLHKATLNLIKKINQHVSK